jgi:hypothetical protein
MPLLLILCCSHTPVVLVPAPWFNFFRHNLCRDVLQCYSCMHIHGCAAFNSLLEMHRQHACRTTWLETGSVTVTGDIPPGKEAYFNTAECTLELRPGCEQVYATAFTPHAHFLGRSVWTEHYRPDNYGALTYVRFVLFPRAAVNAMLRCALCVSVHVLQWHFNEWCGHGATDLASPLGLDEKDKRDQCRSIIC